MNRSPMRRSPGYTLTEMAITLAILAIAVVIAVPRLNRASENGELRDAAAALDGSLDLARSEAIRTGDVHLFFLFEDAEGNPLTDARGNPVPIAIVNDGAPGSPNQNCKVDPGERKITPDADAIQKMVDKIGAPPAGTGKPDDDMGQGNAATRGSTFADPSGGESTWVMFRPDGSPVAFDSACNVGSLGSGAGTLYLSNGDRSYAVSLSAMGTAQVTKFNEATGAWE